MRETAATVTQYHGGEKKRNKTTFFLRIVIELGVKQQALAVTRLQAASFFQGLEMTVGRSFHHRGGFCPCRLAYILHSCSCAATSSAVMEGLANSHPTICAVVNG